MSFPADHPDRVARDLIASETFTPEETVEVMVGKGYGREEAKRTVEVALQQIERSKNAPARKAAQARARTGARLIRAGIFVGVVGLAFGIVGGAGILYPIMVYVLAATLFISGLRMRRSAGG